MLLHWQPAYIYIERETFPWNRPILLKIRKIGGFSFVKSNKKCIWWQLSIHPAVRKKIQSNRNQKINAVWQIRALLSVSRSFLFWVAGNVRWKLKPEDVSARLKQTDSYMFWLNEARFGWSTLIRLYRVNWIPNNQAKWITHLGWQHVENSVEIFSCKSLFRSHDRPCT